MKLDNRLISGLDRLPVGVVLPFSHGAIETGWLECDGSPISRETYSALFAKIGVLYGVGDGSTTFNLPDYRGQFLRGFDNGRGKDVGRTLGSNQLDAFQGHDFGSQSTGYSTGLRTSSLNSSGGSYNVFTDDTRFTGTKSSIISDGTNGTPRTSSETRPTNVSVIYCIKTFDYVNDPTSVDVSTLIADVQTQNSKIQNINNGVADYKSPETTYVAGGALVFNHGFGVVPSDVKIYAKCINASQGIAVGQLVPLNSNCQNISTNYGMSYSFDATTIRVQIATSGLTVVNASGVFANILPADFKIVVVAYKGNTLTGIQAPAVLDMAPFAIGKFSGTSTGTAIIAANNFASITRVSTGVYNFVFNTPYKDVNYVVITQRASVNTALTTDLAVTAQSETGFQLQTINRTGVVDDCPMIHVMCIGF